MNKAFCSSNICLWNNMFCHAQNGIDNAFCIVSNVKRVCHVDIQYNATSLCVTEKLLKSYCKLETDGYACNLPFFFSLFSISNVKNYVCLEALWENYIIDELETWITLGNPLFIKMNYALSSSETNVVLGARGKIQEYIT